MLSFSRDRALMIVCDGMGGAKSGNVASSLAVDVFTDEVRRCQKSGLTPELAAEILRGALELANKAVYEQAQLSDDFSGMGTTLVAALILKDTAVIINVGDSRAYLFTPDGVQLLTVDHSIVEYMVPVSYTHLGRVHRRQRYGRKRHENLAQPPGTRRISVRDEDDCGRLRGQGRYFRLQPHALFRHLCRREAGGGRAAGNAGNPDGRLAGARKVRRHAHGRGRGSGSRPQKQSEDGTQLGRKGRGQKSGFLLYTARCV